MTRISPRQRASATALVARLLLFKNTLLDDFKLSLDADLARPR